MKYSKLLPKEYRKKLWGMNWCNLRCIRNFEKECENMYKQIKINNNK